MVALNEEQAIAKVIGDIRSVVPDAEVVVVDSSKDRTAEIAERLGCRVIRQLPARGYGPALHEALQAAHGECVVTIDCDDTYPAEEIPKLTAKLKEGFDIVSASRLATRPKAMPVMNYMANRLFALLASWLCGVGATDVHTGMRAYRRKLIREFPYDPHGMALPVELLVGPVQKGYRFSEVFIDYRPRLGETTLKPLEGTIWTLRRLWRWRRFFGRQPQAVARSHDPG